MKKYLKEQKLEHFQYWGGWSKSLNKLVKGNSSVFLSFFDEKCAEIDHLLDFCLPTSF